MSYYVSYRHGLGDAVLRVYEWEIPSVLKNLFSLALQGHEFSNVTITRI